MKHPAPKHATLAAGAILAGLVPVAARAAAGDVVETSLGVALFNAVRSHPVGILLTFLAVIAVIALATAYVVRRVKHEARGYLDTSRERWNGVRSRFSRRPDARDDVVTDDMARLENTSGPLGEVEPPPVDPRRRTG